MPDENENETVVVAEKATVEVSEPLRFTQADVDRIVLARADQLARTKFGDYADVKAKAKRLEDLEAAQASDLEKAVAAARQDTERTVRAEVTRERVLDRIEVLAAKDFADPEDARLRLGVHVSDFVGGDGTVDVTGIQSALIDLLKSKPHLAAVKDDGRPKGNADQGVRPIAEPVIAPGMERLRAAFATPPK